VMADQAHDAHQHHAADNGPDQGKGFIAEGQGQQQGQAEIVRNPPADQRSQEAEDHHHHDIDAPCAHQLTGEKAADPGDKHHHQHIDEAHGSIVIHWA